MNTRIVSWTSYTRIYQSNREIGHIQRKKFNGADKRLKLKKSFFQPVLRFSWWMTKSAMVETYESSKWLILLTLKGTRTYQHSESMILLKMGIATYWFCYLKKDHYCMSSSSNLCFLSLSLILRFSTRSSGDRLSSLSSFSSASVSFS